MNDSLAALSFHLEDVSVNFGATAALKNFQLDINPGERVAFVGPSGAGKTTLLRLLNATVMPSSGIAKINGHILHLLSAAELRKLRAEIGFVHQDLNLVTNLRAVHNILLGRVGRSSFFQTLKSLVLPSGEQSLAVYNLLERVGMPEKLYQRTDQLSGGQQQRVAIARALYQEPRALLADEPVSSVDPARARDTVALFCELSTELGLTLCMSLHNLELAREFFPRLIGMRQGEIVFDRLAKDVGDEHLRELYQLRQAPGIRAEQ